jgi:hypothetical protein
MRVCPDAIGIFKSHPIRSKFEMEIQNDTERDLRCANLFAYVIQYNQSVLSNVVFPELCISLLLSASPGVTTRLDSFELSKGMEDKNEDGLSNHDYCF